MDLLPLLRQLTIQHTDGSIHKLNPNWAQLDYLSHVHERLDAGRPVRLIVLKARQLGISTITEALMFQWAFISERMRGLVMAHEMDSSHHLLGMIDLFWDTYPYRNLYDTKYNARNEKAWMQTGSSIKVATAENARAGRSRTIHFLHASEVGFYRYAKETMLGMRQAIHEQPGTFIVLESTANGVGNWFYNQWQAAEAGDTDYVPLFYPWHRHPEYTASYIRLPHKELGRLDNEERALRNIGISDDRLAWRRWAINNKTDGDLLKFHQEYPTTPDEAFITTGSNVFQIGDLRQCYQPMNGLRGRLVKDSSGRGQEFQKDIQGPLTIFRYPSDDEDWGVYICGADPNRVSHGADYAVVQVLSRRNLEQMAVWRGKIDPGHFADVIAAIGRYYNTALVIPETTGPGSTTLGGLQAMRYPHIFKRRTANRTPGRDEIQDSWGWDTTHRSKDEAIGWLLKYVSEHSILIHDKTTFTEMKDYVVLDNGEYGPASSDGHDDTVMALSIAAVANAKEPPLLAYAGAQKQEEEPGWMGWGDQVEAL